MRWLVPGSVAAAIVAAVVITVLVIAMQPKAQSVQAGAGPRNMATDGVQFRQQDGKSVPVQTGAIPKSGTPTTPSPVPGTTSIVISLDLSCPTCKAFEEATSDYVQGLVASGKATLELKPVAILDRSYGGSHYSPRVNNAAACVADADLPRFLAFVTKMYAIQPSELSTGLTDEQITAAAHEVGATDPGVDRCIADDGFGSWVTAATQRAADAGLTGTPWILVNGVEYQPSDYSSLGEFQAFVDAHS